MASVCYSCRPPKLNADQPTTRSQRRQNNPSMQLLRHPRRNPAPPPPPPARRPSDQRLQHGRAPKLQILTRHPRAVLGDQDRCRRNGANAGVYGCGGSGQARGAGMAERGVCGFEVWHHGPHPRHRSLPPTRASGLQHPHQLLLPWLCNHRHDQRPRRQIPRPRRADARAVGCGRYQRANRPVLATREAD